MKYLLFLCSLIALISCTGNSLNSDDSKEVDPLSCNKSNNLSNIIKPQGIFTSVITNGAVLNPAIQGGLIRVSWADLEPSPGTYDFSSIDNKLALLPEGKKWSLGIHGGWSSVDTNDPDLYDGTTYPNGQLRPTIELQMSPPWLVSNFSVETFEMTFRNVTVYMPKYWDLNLKLRLGLLLDAVAASYNSDSDLQLVYVPQMTSNGIEGHFNGVDSNILMSAAGINLNDIDAEDQFEDIWVESAIDASKMTANAFTSKAIAFEVHEMLGRVSIPQKIMNQFLTDSEFEDRVGIGMWWISGGTTYQPNLIEVIKNYPGDLYGQVIGNSSQPEKFPEGNFSKVFEQAKELCMRYIEPWNYEFENNTNNNLMTDFNEYSLSYFK